MWRQCGHCMCLLDTDTKLHLKYRLDNSSPLGSSLERDRIELQQGNRIPLNMGSKLTKVHSVNNSQLHKLQSQDSQFQLGNINQYHSNEYYRRPTYFQQDNNNQPSTLQFPL
jgi:hypothetical protein